MSIYGRAAQLLRQRGRARHAAYEDNSPCLIQALAGVAGCDDAVDAASTLAELACSDLSTFNARASDEEVFALLERAEPAK